MHYCFVLFLHTSKFPPSSHVSPVTHVQTVIYTSSTSLHLFFYNSVYTLLSNKTHLQIIIYTALYIFYKLCMQCIVMHIVGLVFITVYYWKQVYEHWSWQDLWRTATRCMKMNITLAAVCEDVWRKKVKSLWWRWGRVESSSEDEH